MEIDPRNTGKFRVSIVFRSVLRRVLRAKVIVTRHDRGEDFFG